MAMELACDTLVSGGHGSIAVGLCRRTAPSHLAESGFFPVMRTLKACALGRVPGRSTAPRAPLAHPRPGRPRCVHVPLTCSAGPAPGTRWSRSASGGRRSHPTPGNDHSAPFKVRLRVHPRGRLSSPFVAEDGGAVCARTPHLSSAAVSGDANAAILSRLRWVTLPWTCGDAPPSGTTSRPPARVCTPAPSLLHANTRPLTFIQLLVSSGL